MFTFSVTLSGALYEVKSKVLGFCCLIIPQRISTLASFVNQRLVFDLGPLHYD